MPKRQVLNIPGLGHGTNPIPFGVKIGGVLYTGSIDGRDPATGQASADHAEQIAQAFRNIRTLLELAGGTVADIAKVDVRLRDMGLRAAVNQEWVAMFPDEQDRPVRHTSQADFHGNTALQIEITAHVD